MSNWDWKSSENLTRKIETPASESYFEMKASAQYPRIALIRDVTDSNVIKLLLES